MNLSQSSKMKRSNPCFLWALLLLVATGCQSISHANAKIQAIKQWDQVRAEFKVQLAQQQYNSGHFNEVLLSATNAISLDPTRPTAYELLANANLELDKPASAMKVIKFANKANIRSAELIYAEGVIYEQRDQLEKAISQYALAFQADSSQVDFLIAQAECLVAKNQYQEALTLLDDNVHQLDEYGAVMLLSAHIVATMGDSQEAILRYRKARESLGDDPMIIGELGMLLAQSNRCNEAIPLLQPSIDAITDVEMENGSTRRALAICYLAKNNPKKANEVLMPYTTNHPEDSHAQMLHAKAALALNDIITAMQCANRANESAPHNTELWLIQATIQWKRGEFNQAATTLIDLLTNKPEDLEALCLMAEVLRSKNQFDGARGYFQQALKIDPKCVWAKAGLKSLKQARRRIHETKSARLTAAR